MAWFALWLLGSILGALAIGRVLGMAPDWDCDGSADHDVWGCDCCERQAVELSKANHPSSRVTCPDYVPDWL